MQDFIKALLIVGGAMAVGVAYGEVRQYSKMVKAIAEGKCEELARIYEEHPELRP